MPLRSCPVRLSRKPLWLQGPMTSSLPKKAAHQAYQYIMQRLPQS